MFGNLNAITKGKIRICGWWLIENGAINFGYTGPYDEFGVTLNIVNGQLVF